MIDKNEIHRVGKQLAFNPWQAEKDYLQHLFLRELYSSISQELVFKGGTCLQKAYGLHRFSRDLDFNLTKNIKITSVIERVAKKLADIGLFNKISKTEESVYSLNFLIEFNSSEMKNSLTIQISKREKLGLESKQVSITPLYSDIPPYFVMCMDEQEIAAEKIRAIYERAFPRDVYDFWFLLRKGIKLDSLLIGKKLIRTKQHYDKKILLNKIAMISKNWNELKDLLVVYPEFDSVMKDVEEKL